MGGLFFVQCTWGNIYNEELGSSWIRRWFKVSTMGWHPCSIMIATFVFVGNKSLKLNSFLRFHNFRVAFFFFWALKFWGAFFFFAMPLREGGVKIKVGKRLLFRVINKQ